MVFYNSFKKLALDGSIDFVNDTIKVALLTNAYTPNIDNDEYWDDVSTHEVSGTGYTAGGQALSSKTTVKNTTSDEGVYDGADVTWAASTITARYGVIYKSTGTASTSALVCYIDFDVDKTTSASDFVIAWGASGIFDIA